MKTTKSQPLIFLPDEINTLEKREYMSLMEGGRTNTSKEMYEAGKPFHSLTLNNNKACGYGQQNRAHVSQSNHGVAKGKTRCLIVRSMSK